MSGIARELNAGADKVAPQRAPVEQPGGATHDQPLADARAGPSVPALAGDRRVVLHLQRTAGNRSVVDLLASTRRNPLPAGDRAAVQRQDAANKIAQLDEYLGRWNVPEEDVIALLGGMNAREKNTVLSGGYRRQLAGALNVSEMVRAVTNLGPPLSTKLEWIDAAALTARLISYADIQGLITSAPAGERAALKTLPWRSFFVKVCTNATMRQAVEDLGFDLATKLEWLHAEATSLREIDYADIKAWITAAGADERAALKTPGWRSFFVDVCTNATIREAVVDLGFDLVTKLDWIRAELFSVRLELSLADIRDLITSASDEERAALNTPEWRSFFVQVCSNETMAELVDILFTTLRDKLSWMAAEGASWEQLQAKIQATTDEAQKLAVYADDAIRDAFVSACNNAQMADAVVMLGGRYQTHKKPWLEAEGTSASEYLDALVRNRVFATGSVAHTSAQAAQEAIADKLGELVAGARGDGRTIVGLVAVVDDDDWDVAGLESYGDDWATTRDTINGWVDDSGRVWIHRNRGNPGTMIHEALHKWSSDLRSLSWHLNEGSTEYFTRKVCAGFSPNLAPGRANYQAQWTATTALSGFVGEATLAAAFFDGAKDGLRDAYNTARGNTTDWRLLLAAYQAKNWPQVSALIAPAPPPPAPVAAPIPAGGSAAAGSAAPATPPTSP